MVVDEDRLRRLERTLITRYGALMTLRQWAELTGRSVKTVYNERAEGHYDVPTLKQGRRYWVATADAAYVLLERISEQERRDERRTPSF